MPTEPNQNDELDNEQELTDSQAAENNELETLQAKAQEYLDGWKRAKADYLNFKKESEGRQKEIIQYANASLIAELIPIFNHYKMAWQHIPSDFKKENWMVGFEHVLRQFEDFFKSLGIDQIKTVGEKFNPELHEAIDSQKVDEYEADLIYEEAQPGYTLHGKVVVPAKVRVAK